MNKIRNKNVHTYYERIYLIRILITLFIDWQTYCLSFAQLNSIDSIE